MEKINTRSKKRIVLLFVLLGLVAAVTVLVQFRPVAEYAFSRGIARGLSYLVNRLTNFLPFSLYEWVAVALIILCPLLLIAIVVFLCRGQKRRAGVWLYRILVAVLAVCLTFVTLYGGGYRREPLNGYLSVTEQEVTEERLEGALSYYIGQFNAASAELARDESGNVAAPLTFQETANSLNEAYDALPDTGYLSRYTVRPKQVLMSDGMSYLGITGIYFPFIAESNVNTNVFDAELPFVMAHEMAHAKGVSRENEANFMAYYLCIRSQNSYLQYSGLYYAVNTLLGAMRTCNPERYESLRETVAPEIRTESRNIVEANQKYDSFIGQISTFFNNLFLKSNGVADGVKSYGATTKSLLGLYVQMIGA